MTDTDKNKNDFYVAITQVKNGFMLKHQQDGGNYYEEDNDFYIAPTLEDAFTLIRGLVPTA